MRYSWEGPLCWMWHPRAEDEAYIDMLARAGGFRETPGEMLGREVTEKVLLQVQRRELSRGSIANCTV